MQGDSQDLITIIREVEESIGVPPSILSCFSSDLLSEEYTSFSPIDGSWPYQTHSIDIVICTSDKLDSAHRVARRAIVVTEDGIRINKVLQVGQFLPDSTYEESPVMEQIKWAISGSKEEVGKIFIAAPMMPEFDRESGSRRLFHLMLFFRKAGYRVDFFADCDQTRDSERYIRYLQIAGIHTMCADKYSVNDAVKESHSFSFCLIPFWNYAKQILPTIKREVPTAKIILDSVDLHFIRQARKQFLQHGRLSSPFDTHVVGELNTYALADHVLTVSEKEASLINNLFASNEKAFPIRDCESEIQSIVPLKDRNGIVFIGNFRHKPNIDSLTYFLTQIAPHISPEVLEKHPICLVGNKLPAEEISPLIAGFPSDSIRLVGWVPEVLPYLEFGRISVVPLTYGAGTKRKLIQSLMTGTPAVVTSIGAEGFELENGKHVLIEDEPIGFAKAIEWLCEDDGLWQKLSNAGELYIREKHLLENVFCNFRSIIHDLEKRG